MASIFTYDPDPPRVASPWLKPNDAGVSSDTKSSNRGTASPGLLSDYGVTRLQAEPQEGPTEYKLHLLLRSRRRYQTMSTAGQSNVYNHRKRATSQSEASVGTNSGVSSTKQSRLQHLTTQLLWRLQQSSPYHASSSKELVIPHLHNDCSNLEGATKSNALIPGLEESRGALYEIGVADDGTLVGLTSDEMDESISTLKSMAASLGCSVEVLRMVIVGDCSWVEATEPVSSQGAEKVRYGKLWVAEALVFPELGLQDTNGDDANLRKNGSDVSGAGTPAPVAVPSQGSSATPQLRITLTGPTTSGKSSLLGTLSTGTLDNGRGKSRLSLLRHQHEVASGVTSSIAQEIIGYKDHTILNFSQVNIESWTDIHDRSENGRLVFVSDSGGHPRYRRTVLRGLMNWAPHWSILCIAADDGESIKPHGGDTVRNEGTSGTALAPTDLVRAHLRLSLKLDVPMAVVVTKLDLASKASLQKTVGKILTAVKEAKRTPKIVQPDQKQHDNLKEIPAEDCTKVHDIINSITAGEKLTETVPIILTSAVKGIGIGTLHALLESLPLPALPTSKDFIGMAMNPEQPRCLFHIDDTFKLPASYANLAGNTGQYSNHGVVVVGYMRFGNISVGDRILIGPFPAEGEEEVRGSVPKDRPFPSSYSLSISHPSSAELARIAMRNAVSASTIAGEWHSALVVSIRNLRLPVRTLISGQAGSIGIVFESQEKKQDDGMMPEKPRVRRGMVMAIPSKHMQDSGIKLQAASGFTAMLTDPAAESLVVGAFVNVYVASVRAAAKIVGITRHRASEAPSNGAGDVDDVFALNEELEHNLSLDNFDRISGWEVSLELLHSREWIEMCSSVIILEGGSHDRSGLEGVVGKVIEIIE